MGILEYIFSSFWTWLGAVSFVVVLVVLVLIITLVIQLSIDELVKRREDKLNKKIYLDDGKSGSINFNYLLQKLTVTQDDIITDFDILGDRIVITIPTIQDLSMGDSSPTEKAPEEDPMIVLVGALKSYFNSKITVGSDHSGHQKSDFDYIRSTINYSIRIGPVV